MQPTARATADASPSRPRSWGGGRSCAARSCTPRSESAWWAAATWLISISGASRELTEGFGSLLAAAVLVSVGVWMHGKSKGEAGADGDQHGHGVAGDQRADPAAGPPAGRQREARRQAEQILPPAAILDRVGKGHDAEASATDTEHEIEAALTETPVASGRIGRVRPLHGALGLPLHR